MADPATLTVMAITAASSYSQSQAQQAEGGYQSQQYEQNARFARLQAEDAKVRGDLAAQQKLGETRRLIGSQRAALAAQGIDIESGSALQVQTDTKSIGAMDALMIRTNAAREAWGYEVNASDLSSKGLFADLASSNASKSTLATGGLNVAGEYAAYKRSPLGQPAPKSPRVA